MPHGKIEELCLKAVEAAELKDGFVLVDELGDFSVRYRVSGMLEDVKRLVSARSRLRMAVLDALHEGGVEIVSPNFMNQRPLPDGKRMIPPRPKRAEDSGQSVSPESLVFDKADEAASIESLNQRLGEVNERILELEEAARNADDDGKEAAEKRVQDAKLRKERLEAFIAARHEKLEKKD